MPVTENAASLPEGADLAAFTRDLERILAAQRDPVFLTDPNNGDAVLIVGGEVQSRTPSPNPVLPDFITARPTMLTAESFLAYAADYDKQSGQLVVNVAEIQPSITLDFDYHAVDGPGRRGHRLTWQMRTSLNYQRWAGIDGKTLTQKAFTEFLEENEVDVHEPVGAALRELIQSVNGTKNVSFQAGHRLANGDTEIKWIEETEAKTRGGTTLPGFFILGLPIFFGDVEATPIRAILRYAVDDGKLTFKVILHRRQEIFEKAVEEQAHRVGAMLNMTPLFGSLP